MPALCAVRDDQPQFKDLFERVYQRTGKKMKGLCCCTEKIIGNGVPSGEKIRPIIQRLIWK
ncbi:hypothetical protein ACFOG5_23600 [Pedobacter fastidiosus]|uniref:hypothetical protein n=1 Tax=Pedobacter fastidiosus TaxID=2765361 RepID=UPI0036207BB9